MKNEDTTAHPSILKFEDHDVRMIDRSGEPWWVAKDVCDVLSIANSRRAIDGLRLSEKGVHTVNTLGGAQEMQVVNEAGLYKLIFKSRKPDAERFQDWVTHDVLPSLRKTGIYVVPGAGESPVYDGAMGIVTHMAKLDLRLERIEVVLAEAENDARHLPEPVMDVLPEMTNAASINDAARKYSRLTGIRLNSVMKMVYSEVEFRFGIRLTSRKARAHWKGTTLGFAIHAGYADMVYAVLYNMIRRAIDGNQRAA